MSAAEQNLQVKVKPVPSIFTVYSVTGMCFVKNYADNIGKIFISGSFGINSSVDGEGSHWAIGCANVCFDGNEISYEELRFAQDGRNSHLVGRVGANYCCLNSMCTLFGNECIAVAAWTLPTDDRGQVQQPDEALYILIYEIDDIVRSNFLTLRQTLELRTPPDTDSQDFHDHISLAQRKEQDGTYSLLVAVRDSSFAYRFTGGRFRATRSNLLLFENTVADVIDLLNDKVRYFDLPVNSDGVSASNMPIMASVVTEQNGIELHDRFYPSFKFSKLHQAPQHASNWNPGRLLVKSLGGLRAEASEIAFLEDGNNLRISVNHDRFQVSENVFQGVDVTAWTFVELVRSASDTQPEQVTRKLPLGHLILFDGAVSRFRSYAVKLKSDHYAIAEPRGNVEFFHHSNLTE